MHDKILPNGSRELLDRLGNSDSPNLVGWYLAGGTGLALHFGHRISEDFDFFRTDELSLSGLHETLRGSEPCEMLQEADHTLTLICAGVKLSFFIIRDPLIFETTSYRFFEIADVRDIALMKLIAISGRGSRKDFVDLHTILRGGLTLQECFNLLPKKYGAGRANEYHILKSLAYFQDAEGEPMPLMLEPFDWEECKAYFIRESHSIVLG